MTKITYLETIKNIEKQYLTGDMPVLVTCNNHGQYICKYMRSDSASAYKLVSEFLGTKFAKCWGIETPSIVFLKINPAHFANFSIPYKTGSTAIGFLKINDAIDITDSTCGDIEPQRKMFWDLLKIALFDFWIANEDRTCNNSNLIYSQSIFQEKLISIDYGGIFNTNSYSNGLQQLSASDSILCADIFNVLKTAGMSQKDEFAPQRFEDIMKTYFYSSVERCKSFYQEIKSNYFPSEWNISDEIVDRKVSQLFDDKWIDECLNNFLQTFYQNF